MDEASASIIIRALLKPGATSSEYGGIHSTCNYIEPIPEIMENILCTPGWIEYNVEFLVENKLLHFPALG